MQPIQKGPVKIMRNKRTKLLFFLSEYAIMKLDYKEKMICTRGDVSMDIPEVSMALANVNLSTKVGTAVLSKALDSSQSLGDSLVSMMDQSMALSVNPDIGSNFDMKI